MYVCSVSIINASTCIFMKKLHLQEDFTGTKDHLLISFLGSVPQKVNILFEVYRKAIDFELKGYIKNQADNHIEILIEGHIGDTERFMTWLTILMEKQEKPITVKKPEVWINYQNFRIIH